jgi:HTH-type transcriptional regulator/antitoxin HigA
MAEMKREPVRAKRRPDVAMHPGELLSEELDARAMTQRDLARAMGRSPGMVSEIVRCRTRVTVDTALDLEGALGIQAELWLNMQSRYDLVEGRRRRGARAS